MRLPLTQKKSVDKTARATKVKYRKSRKITVIKRISERHMYLTSIGRQLSHSQKRTASHAVPDTIGAWENSNQIVESGDEISNVSKSAVGMRLCISDRSDRV